MRSKKGIELSINFIIVMLMSLVIFVGGLYMTNKFFGLANNQRTEIDQETEQQIRNLLSDGSKVAVPFNKQALNKGSGHVFGIGIHNINQDRRFFRINVTFDEGGAVDPRGNLIGANGTHMNRWILYSNDTIMIESNSDYTAKVYAKVQGTINSTSATLKGEYAFNICVFEKTVTSLKCPPTTGTSTYDGFIHKFYIEVK